MTAIRTFMAEPNLELSFVNTDLPMPYFRVGKVTKMSNGENMEAVDGWVRKVNVYGQKELVGGQCGVYEYQVDARNHTLTAVHIRGLREGEIEALKKSSTSCTDTHQMPKITKAEAEKLAMDYLRRAISNFDGVKNQLIYNQPVKNEAHEWRWEDKSYKLPEGLTGRPYSYPITRIAIYGDRSLLYENTVSLFKN